MTGRLSVNLCLAAAIVATALTATARAAPDPDDLVKAELLSDSSAVKPGQPFTVGVALKLAPKWHVYWINPGETGLPTKVEFKLPAGWTAGPVRYPVPKEFVQPGDIAGYGYEDEVVLLATITPATDTNVGGATEKIAARVSWLVCDPKQCIPGRANVQTTVTVADATIANEVVRAALKRWSERVPVEPKAAKDVAVVEWNSRDGEIAGTVSWTGDARDVKLFPGEDDALEISDIRIDPAGGRKSRVAMRVRRLAGQTPRGDALPAVLAYTNAAGERRGVEVSIPLTAAAADRNAQARRNE